MLGVFFVFIQCYLVSFMILLMLLLWLATHLPFDFMSIALSANKQILLSCCNNTKNT